jgi:hypothetical protein
MDGRFIPKIIVAQFRYAEQKGLTWHCGHGKLGYESIMDGDTWIKGTRQVRDTQGTV